MRLKKQVDGFSGAEYKSFEQITDATEYLDWNEKTQGEVLQKDEDTLQQAIKKIKQKSTNVKNDVVAPKKKKSSQKNKPIAILKITLQLPILMAVLVIQASLRVGM